jgi:hypothetical protein
MRQGAAGHDADGHGCAIMLDMREGAWLNVLHIKLSVKSNSLRAVVIIVIASAQCGI